MRSLRTRYLEKRTKRRILQREGTYMWKFKSLFVGMGLHIDQIPCVPLFTNRCMVALSYLTVNTQLEQRAEIMIISHEPRDRATSVD